MTSSSGACVGGTLAEEKEFLVRLFVLGDFGGGADFLDFGVASAGGILIAGLDDDVALFAESLEIFAEGRLHTLAIELLIDLIFDFGKGLFAFVVMLKDLHDQEALLRFHHFGEVISLHFEDRVFKFFGELAALVLPQISALFGGGAVGIALGNFTEVFSVLDALPSRFGFLLQVGYFRSVFASRIDLDGSQSDLFGPHEFLLVLVVILLDFVLGDADVGANLAADHLFGEQTTADIVLEIFPVETLLGNGFLESFHAGEFIFDADLVELLDDIRLDADAHVFGALYEKGLVDQFAERVFLAVLDQLVQLFGSATVLAV